MLEHVFPTKLIKLIRATLDGFTSSVRIADEISHPFVTLDGLEQDDGRSNLLFNIALAGVVRRAGVQMSGAIITKSHLLLGFADDIDIIGVNRRVMEKAFVPCKREAASIGLIISSAKSKYMVAAQNVVVHLVLVRLR